MREMAGWRATEMVSELPATEANMPRGRGGGRPETGTPTGIGFWDVARCGK